MAKYQINKSNEGTSGFSQTVEAAKYDQRGDYFVFLNSQSQRVLTVAADLVRTVDLTD